jgi:WD40 repeat protein/tRNA A-37 threonylcarbamoyl transferase component Bud32
MSDPSPTRSIPPDQVPPAPPEGAADPAATVLAPDSATPPGGSGVAPPAPVPGYEIEGELGRGGMGVVYKARDTRLNRTVALKMVQADGPADARHLIRFLAEAEAVAAVRHPHVVQIYEFGEHGGRPFIALEYLPGGSLTDRLRGGNPSPPAEAAALVARLARGVQAAHAAGVVHRDVKPSNVLFDAGGEPKVTDFGLAKKTGAADLTRTQAVMGTPAYMAPEQAEGRGKFVGPQADVYALGVILYECLTGTVPFEGDSVMAVLRRVADEEPEQPRKRRPGVPRDLELVCLRCLRKNSADRYPTAGELADDLERFVRGEPVSVRAAGFLERAYRWARRNPSRAAAVALGTTAAALVVVGLVLGLALSEASHARRQAEAANASLTDAKAALEQALARERGAREEVASALGTERALKGRLETALGGEREAKAQLVAAQQEIIRQGYFRSVDLAHRAVLDGEPGRAAAILDLCPRELRDWEWNHARRKLDSAQLKLAGPGDALQAARAVLGPVETARLEVSPTGPWVVDGRARIWDLRTGEVLIVPDLDAPVAFTTDGRLRTLNADPPVVADVRTGDRTRLPALSRGFEPVGRISPDGRWSVARPRGKYDSVSVVDTRTGKPVLTLKPDKAGEFFLPGTRFSPDGERVAVGSVGERVEVWDVASGKRVAALTAAGHTNLRPSLLFRSNGRDLLTAGGDGTVRVWDVASGMQRFSMTVSRGGAVTAAYSPDGTRIAACGPLGLILCDAETGAELWAVPPGGAFDGVAFSPDGARLATWGGHSVRIRDAAGGQTVRVLDGHPGQVKAAGFVPDGRLVSVSEPGPVHVWDDQASETLVLLGWGNQKGNLAWHDSTAVAVDPAGARVAVPGSVPVDAAGKGGLGYRNGIAVWDLNRREAVAILRGTPSDPLWVAFAPGGGRLLFGTLHGRVSEWDISTGKPVPTRYWVVSGSPTAVHPDRRLLAVLDERAGRVSVWDVSRVPERLVTSGRRFAPEDARKDLPPDECPVLRGEFAAPGPNPVMAFSPDGGHIVVLPHGRPGIVWEVDAGRGWPTAGFAVGLPHAFPFGGARATVALGPGGRRVVLAAGGELKVADVRSGAEAVTLSRRGEGDLFAPFFSRDGSTLYALTYTGVAVFESTPRPAFVPHRFESAPPPRLLR